MWALCALMSCERSESETPKHETMFGWLFDGVKQIVQCDDVFLTLTHVALLDCHSIVLSKIHGQQELPTQTGQTNTQTEISLCTTNGRKHIVVKIVAMPQGNPTSTHASTVVNAIVDVEHPASLALTPAVGSADGDEGWNRGWNCGWPLEWKPLDQTLPGTD